MSQEEPIDAFVKGYEELAQVCGYTTEQIEKAEKVIACESGESERKEQEKQSVKVWTFPVYWGSDGHLIEGQMYFYDRT